METALLNYFVQGTQLLSTCDFNPYVLEKGTGIYEVVRVEEGLPLFLQEHITRFFSSAELENITVNISGQFIRKAVRILIEQNRMQWGNIKFLFYRVGTDDSRFMAWVIPFAYPPAAVYASGVEVGSMPAERENPNAKKALYTLRRQADNLIREKGFWEVVYVNRKGYLTEGSRSNIFFVNEKKLLTPELSMVLPGITRAKVLQLASEKNIPSEETFIPLSEIQKMNACFLTGTSAKILPVSRFNGIPFNLNDGLMRQLMLWYEEMMQDDLHRFSW